MDVLEYIAYHHGYGGGWGNWIAHMAVSALIHSLIYGFVFRLMHHLTFGEAAVLVVVVLVLLFGWGQSRDRRGW
jgi:hypothetical protein